MGKERPDRHAAVERARQPAVAVEAGLTADQREREPADHHPDVTINFRKVTLSYSTHSEGGVTEKDFAGARAAERVVGA